MRREHLSFLCEDLTASLGGHLDVLEPLRGGRLLVTGGTGFIGTWLAETVAHLNDKHGFGLRLLLSARGTEAFAAAYPHLADRADIELLRFDIRDLHDLPADVSWVIHAGATPDSRVHHSEPARTCDTIVGGTKAVLEAAARLPRLDGFLNLSSGLVYGPQPPELIHAPENIFHGFDPSTLGAVYAESKRQAETLCFAYANQQRLRIVNARPFAFIGPYQGLDRPWAINNFLRDGLHGGPIRILGDGETVRSYQYPSDMAVWLLAILASGISGESYNVGSPEAVTLASAAEKVASLLPSSLRVASPLFSVPARQNSHARFVPDVTKARTGLGLRLAFDLTAALWRTLQWNML